MAAPTTTVEESEEVETKKAPTADEESSEDIKTVQKDVRGNQIAEEIGAAIDLLSDALGSFRNSMANLGNGKSGHAAKVKVGGGRVARGTGGPTRTTVAPPVSAPKAVHKMSLEQALRLGPATESELQEITGLPRQELVDQLRGLRRGRRMTNMGTEGSPLWAMKLGQDASVQDLSDYIISMIEHVQERGEAGVTFRDIVRATGAREGRVSSAITKLREDKRRPITNLGSQKKGIWSLGKA
jgi:hypothetical protein